VSDLAMTGYERPAFRFETLASATNNLVESGSWYVDDVQLTAFVPFNWDTGITLARFYPGPVAKLWIGEGGAGSAALHGQCLDGAAMSIVGRTLDVNNNPTYDSTLSFEFDWNGSATLFSVDRGTLVLYTGKKAEVTFDSGEARIVLIDPVAETVHVDLRNVHGYGSPVFTDVGLDTAGVTLFCHADGLGGFWTDQVAIGTFNSSQALRACENHYGVGQCAASGLDAYWVGSGGNCYMSSTPQFAWRFQAGNLWENCREINWSKPPGTVHCPVWQNDYWCGCDDPVMAGGSYAFDGTYSSFAWCSASTWN